MKLDEEYAHFQESLTSLNRAWRTLCELETSPSDNAIWNAAYRMVIVEYSKPFTKSKINKRKVHSLPLPIISGDLEILHNRILSLRHQVMAHADLTVLDVNVSYDKHAAYPTPLVSKTILGGIPSVIEIKELIEVILDELYKQEDQYELRFKNQS